MEIQLHTILHSKNIRLPNNVHPDSATIILRAHLSNHYVDGISYTLGSIKNSYYE